jgi:hypothetical protein
MFRIVAMFEAVKKQKNVSYIVGVFKDQSLYEI